MTTKRGEALRTTWRTQRGRMLRAVRRNPLKSGAWSAERAALDDAIRAASEFAAALSEVTNERR